MAAAVAAGIARRLEFLVQPTDVEEDRRISPAVEVVVLDQSGNRVTDREFEVKLELVREGRRGKLKGDRDQRTQGGRGQILRPRGRPGR